MTEEKVEKTRITRIDDDFYGKNVIVATGKRFTLKDFKRAISGKYDKDLVKKSKEKNENHLRT